MGQMRTNALQELSSSPRTPLTLPAAWLKMYASTDLATARAEVLVVATRSARGEPFHHVTVLAPGEDVRVEDDRPVQRLGRLGAVLGASNVNTVRWLSPSVEQAGSHMEILRA